MSLQQRLILPCTSVFFLLCLTIQASWAVDFSFSWQPNAETISEYRLYHGLTSGDYTSYIPINKEPDPGTLRVLGAASDLDEKVTHYFAVTACTADGQESDFSDELSACSQSFELALTSPADGAFYASGDTITFSASATDINCEDISTALTWTSDISGAIGTGATLDTSALPDGTHFITASATDANGQVHEQTILLSIGNPTDLVDFSTTSFSSYDTSQDGEGTVTLEDNGTTLSIAGNRWIKTEQVYEITADTILEFDFKSTIEGEIHGIGFDEDDNLDNNQRIFQIFGTQTWDNAIQVYPKYSKGDTEIWTHFSINIGQFYTGKEMHLTLVNDHDNVPCNGNSSFKNIRVTQSFLDFRQTGLINSYNDFQDGEGTVTIEDVGVTLGLTGNRWVKTEQLYDITTNTILEFDFQATTEGEIHGIGFDEDSDINNNKRVFAIFGTQRLLWDNAIQTSTTLYSNTDIGNWVHFTLAIGDFYTGNNMHMVFINDDDRDPATGAEKFSNIKVYSELSRILGDSLNADDKGTVSETFTNINGSILEGLETISTWSWSTPAPHKVANTIILKTDLGTIPANATITEAKIYLYQTSFYGEAEYNNSVHKIIGVNPTIAEVSGYNAQNITPWALVPDGTTYNNVPLGLNNIEPAEDTVLLDSTTGYHSWLITNMVQDWIDNPDSNYGLLIQGESTTVETGRTFAATENLNAAIRPYVVIRYAVGL